MHRGGLWHDQLQRLRRAKGMGWSRAWARIRERVVVGLEPSRNVLRAARALESLVVARFDGPYRERPEAGAGNLEFKLARVRAGGRFEPSDVYITNRAVASLAAHHSKILEVGAGTGAFVAEIKERNPSAMVTASELDPGARGWAAANRTFPGVRYGAFALSDFRDGEFDLVVSVEVVEHVQDYSSFLRQIARVGRKAIVTSPNRRRTVDDDVTSPPRYDGHVREWTAGEFYWVLRTWFPRVELHTIPQMQRQVRSFELDPAYSPKIVSCGTLCMESPIIAVCYTS